MRERTPSSSEAEPLAHAPSTDTPTRAATGSSTSVALVLAAWALAGAIVAASGVVAAVPVGAPLFIGGGTAALVLAARRLPKWRAAVERIPTRAVVLGHALRAPIGASFLAALAAGELPRTFALRAGWGDIAVGLTAVAVGLYADERRATGPLVWTWTLLGLVDILMAVGTAQHALLVLHDPLAARALGGLPYGLLPTFVVPLVIGTHILLIMRLMGARAALTARHVT